MQPKAGQSGHAQRTMDAVPPGRQTSLLSRGPFLKLAGIRSTGGRPILRGTRVPHHVGLAWPDRGCLAAFLPGNDLRPISLLRISLLRLLDSSAPGNSHGRENSTP